MRQRAERRGDQSGTAIVELAFVLSLFVLLVFGGITFGYGYTIRENMTHATQEGLRDALVNGLDSSTNTCTSVVKLRDCIAVGDVRARMAGVVGTTRNQEPYPIPTIGGTACNGPWAAQPTGTVGGALQVCTDYNNTASAVTNFTVAGVTFPGTTAAHSFPPCTDSGGNVTTGTCMTVIALYDYRDNSLASLPLVDNFIPTEIVVTATQRIS
jgi:Flp pilus assembly protein TadG